VKPLITEVIPRVEEEYSVTKDRNSRAIAGLSMGGSESLLTGLNNLDKFGWIGAFSTGGITEEFDMEFPAVNPSPRRIFTCSGSPAARMTV